jgi:hypothetical protein
MCDTFEHFPGYVNPFWYEKKKNIYTKLYWKIKDIELKAKLEREKKRPNIAFGGTQPDIEIRWKK